MNSIEHFHFLRPFWLLLVPVVLGFWWLVQRQQDPLRGWRVWMDPDLLDALTMGRISNPSGRRATSSVEHAIPSHAWGACGLLAAWLTAVLAVSGPTWRPEPSPFADDPVPVMLVLKAGETMNLTDLSPSRIERARLKIADFAAERRGQPLGLIAYAGSAHLVLPPTRDTSVVATMAAEIDPSMMPRAGDDLAAALRLAARTLGDAGGSIVVLADTAPPENEFDGRELRNEGAWPVHFLAIARADTPEGENLRAVATALKASVTPLTPDSADVLNLVRRTATAPVPVAAAAEGTRWAEAGWWLVPVLALLSLQSFRRVRDADLQGDGPHTTAYDEPGRAESEEMGE